MRLLACALAAVAAVAVGVPPASASIQVDTTGTSYTTDRVVVPMTYPVVGTGAVNDTYLACRSGCSRKHLGQDLMGPKMTPLVATFDGIVTSLRRETTVGGGNYLTLTGTRGASVGWTAVYLHVNNDTPGTDDGRGTGDWAFPKGIEVGTRVLAGQLVGWRGDSGNAEGTGAHLHFELRKGSGWGGTVYNAYPSLAAARHLAAPSASGPHPDGSLLRTPAGAVWHVSGGVKRPVSAGVLAANGYTAAQVVPASLPEFTLYKSSSSLRLRDGALVRDPAGVAWRVSGATRFPAVGQRVFPVTTADLAGLTVVEPPVTPFTPGAVVRLAGKVYAVSADALLRPVNIYTMATWGWTSADVVPVELPAVDPVLDPPLEASFEVPAIGEPLPPRGGTLVNVSGVGPAVLSAGVVRRLWDAREITAYGYAGRPRLNYPRSLVAGWRTGEIAGP